MSKLVMNIQNPSNLATMIDWCKRYNIAFDVIEDNTPSMPNLVAESQSPSVTPKTISPASDVTVDVTRKDNAVFIPFTSKTANAVINAQLKEAGFVWDKDFVLDDTYKKDYTRNGVTHKAGEHKTGAWVLLTKSGKRDIKGVDKFISEHPTMTATADAINAQRSKWAERAAKRAARA